MVLVDGEEKTSSPNFLQIGYIPQNSHSIDASLAENVAFCDWGHALGRRTHTPVLPHWVMDFLGNLPQNTFTVLGDNGGHLTVDRTAGVIPRAPYGALDTLLFDYKSS